MEYNKINGTINGIVRQAKNHIYKVMVHTNKQGKKTYFAYYTDGGVMDYCEYDRVKRFISKNHKIRNIYLKNGYPSFTDEIYADYIKHDVINECNMETKQIKRLNDKSFNFDYNNGLTTGGKTKEEAGIKRSVEWCAEFVSIVLEKSDIKGNKPCSISCNELIAQIRNSEFWYEPQDDPQRNDIIFFDWNRQSDGGKPLDHVGIITKYENGYITYIDGNSGDGKKVSKHTIPISALRFSGTYQDYYLRYREIETTENKTIDTATLLKSIDKIMLEIDIMRKILRG